MTSANTEFKDSEELIVHSFDYDGCCDQLGVLLLSKAWQDSDLVKTFKEKFAKGYLVTRILADAQSHQVLLMNGSSRQDLPTDTYNRFTQCRDSQNNIDSGSCFQFLVEFEKFLKSILASEFHKNLNIEKFLLPDLYNQLPSGASFDLALKDPATAEMFHGQLNDLITLLTKQSLDKSIPHNPKFDASKISLLYAQIHNLAIAHPNKLIRFNFYEDNEGIAQALIEVFRKHPDLLPQNVILNVHQYEPDSTKPELGPCKTTSLKGTALEPDWNYINNVSLLFAELKDQDLIVKTAQFFNADKIDLALQGFKKKRTVFTMRKPSENTEAPRLFRQEEGSKTNSPEQSVREIIRDEIINSIKKLT